MQVGGGVLGVQADEGDLGVELVDLGLEGRAQSRFVVRGLRA